MKLKRKRLKHLIKILKAVPEDHFDMGRWGYYDSEKHGCKTAGCALGWAASDPKFRKKGLTLRSPDISRGNVPPLGDIIEANGQNLPLNISDYHSFEPVDTNTDASEYSAAVSFFGLSIYQSKYLFSPSLYPCEGSKITPEMVIERIQNLLDKKGTIS